jgi:hypothetical protein
VSGAGGGGGRGKVKVGARGRGDMKVELVAEGVVTGEEECPVLWRAGR